MHYIVFNAESTACGIPLTANPSVTSNPYAVRCARCLAKTSADR